MPDFDLLVRGGELFDGTGAPGRAADVGIVRDRIVAVGRLGANSAAREIDARSLAVAPGFIDIQSQSVLSLLVDGGAVSHIHQGITTEIVGEGASPGQWTPRILERNPVLAEWLASLGLTLDWAGWGGFRERLASTGTSVNLGAYASLDLLRGEVVGYEDRAPSETELRAMDAILDEAMREGAFGLATALAYPPSSYVTEDEIVRLARVSARHGGIYISHVRGESGGVLASIAEAISIGDRAGLPVVIFHLKVAGRANWGRMPEVVAVIEAARARGARVSACQYPYTMAGTFLAAPLPDWVQDGGPEPMLVRLRDPATRARIRREMEERDALLGRIDLDGIQIVQVPEDGDTTMMGKPLTGIARARGEDPFETYFRLLIETRGTAFALFHTMSEDDVRTAMRRPWVSVATDAEATSPRGALGRKLVHPRAYGSFPRVLGRYVRESQVLTLAEAIRKMTSLPASQVGLADRGVVREGAYADLVALDPRTVIDVATSEAPHRVSIGVQDVVVNGVVTVEGGDHTGARAGRALRRA